MEFSCVFHGGAGVITRNSVNSEGFYASLSLITAKIYEFAYHNLTNEKICAVDVAEYAVKLLEDDEKYNAGKGSVLSAAGEHEMEASIMDGKSLRSGAASLVKVFKNPVSVARTVMDKTEHVYMIGSGVEDLAQKHGLERVFGNEYFTVERRKAQLENAKRASVVARDHDLPAEAVSKEDKSEQGTVGCACFYKGSTAAATSTGGMTNKLPGRVGDAPIVGAGTYANNSTCAVSCTGTGELFARSVAAYDISARMMYGGADLEAAVRATLHNGTRNHLPERQLVLDPGSGGVIAVDAATGKVVMDFNCEGMFRGYVEMGSDRAVKAGVGIWDEIVPVNVHNVLKPLPPLVPATDSIRVREVSFSDSAMMQRIGRLRYDVWEGEGAINPALFPDKLFLGDIDAEGRHWIVEDTATGALMAAARLTFHTSLNEGYRDVQLWKRIGRHLPLPTVDLGRLVVDPAYRGRGLAQTLNIVRMHVARGMGAKSIMCTASDANARLLMKLGFVDIGERAEFDDRPGLSFAALQFDFE